MQQKEFEDSTLTTLKAENNNLKKVFSEAAAEYDLKMKLLDELREVASSFIRKKFARFCEFVFLGNQLAIKEATENFEKAHKELEQKRKY